MEITGTIKLINETKEYGAKGFKKRELVLTTEEQYPQHILIEFVKDKCALLDDYQVGQGVRIAININGREWQSPQGEVKYFNSIQGWKIEAAASTTPPEGSAKPDFNPTSTDDLPF